jgi:xanthine dehydrogenase iron-sulfur cluster and FAD-binding subunit A
VIERRWPLQQTVLDLQTRGDNTLNDWFAIGNSVSTIRICLEDPAHNALAAALIVLDAYLTLSDGDTARVDERLLVTGGVDVDGRDGARSAEELCVPRLPRGAQTALAAAKADPQISAAARLSLNGDAAVMLVGIAPHPIRARQIESVVRGRSLNDRIIDLAAQTARSEAQPYGVGDLTDSAAIDHVEDAVRRLFRRLRDRFDADQFSGQANDRRHPPRRR